MHPKTLRKLWPWIEAALPHLHGTHSLQDVWASFCKGRCTLWVGKHCFAITELIQRPQLLEFNIWLAGGDPGPAMIEHHELLPGIEAFARARGASRMTFMGRLTKAAMLRNGWKACDEFQPSHAYYWKDIAP